ncbi:hypothetical protein K1502_004987 [Escherichia coli]|nr:hypothetical protein [Escherichia coli]EHY2166643.1 hypothetical protein [Escherichia coli O157]EFI6712969.1 hypothetical protein [Escherichia coli]EJM7101922.1 hypothetical protein [Escherichia coli]ELN5624378.1 hypothetical protein [Escherichia coli]
MMKQLAGCLAILFAAMWAGWLAHDWHDARVALAEQEAMEATRRAVTEAGQQSARILEKRLEALKGNEIHTERVIHTETVRPVFRNVCATDNYVRLFNARAEAAERTLAGKPADGMPEDTAETGRPDGR